VGLVFLHGLVEGCVAAVTVTDTTGNLIHLLVEGLHLLTKSKLSIIVWISVFILCETQCHFNRGVRKSAECSIGIHAFDAISFPWLLAFTLPVAEVATHLLLELAFSVDITGRNVLAVTLLALAIVLVLAICTSATFLGINPSILVTGVTLGSLVSAPGAIGVAVVRIAGKSLGRKCKLIVTHTRTTHWLLLIFFIAVVVHRVATLLNIFPFFAASTVCSFNIPPASAFVWFLGVFFEDFG